MINIYIDTPLSLQRALIDIFESQDGFAISATSTDAIIVITDKDKEQCSYDTATLCLGTDVSLPIKAQILIKYIRAMYDGIITSEPIVRGNVKLCLQNQTVYIADKCIDLTQKEVDIIKTLLVHESLHRDELLELVWQYDKGTDTHTVQTHIYRLRKKCGADFITSNDKGIHILNSQ